MKIKDKISGLLYRYIKSNGINHSKYGTIYLPEYNQSVECCSSYLDIYNAEGKKMEVFFIRDLLSAHASTYYQSKYYITDRFNFGLDTHLYGQHDILKTMGKPVYRYALFGESEAIAPDDYKVFDTHKGIERDFNYVFTNSDTILDKIDNARFCPFCTTPWYGTERDGGVYNDRQYEVKTKNISMISSAKVQTDLHRFRVQTAIDSKNTGLVDVYGNAVGGAYVDKYADVFSDYRFSIVIENDIKPYYFTEKITTCFAAMTIPIYLGCPRIGEFFNTDGIIIVTQKDLENLPELLKKCTQQEYIDRLPAIIDNYNRVLKYNSTSDYLYENYFASRRNK